MSGFAGNAFAGGGFDRPRMMAALIALVTTLFLISVAPGFPYRRAARRIAVAAYAVALVVVLAWVALWLAGAEVSR